VLEFDGKYKDKNEPQKYNRKGPATPHPLPPLLKERGRTFFVKLLLNLSICIRFNFAFFVLVE